MKKLLLLTSLMLLGTITIYAQKAQNEFFKPIIIAESATSIELENYFPDVKETAYRLMHVPEGMDVEEGNYILTLHGKPKNEIDFIEVSISFLNYAIPVIREETYTIESTKGLKEMAYHPNSKEVEIYTPSAIDNALVLIDNKRVKPEEIIFSSNSVKVGIPSKLKMKNISKLRAYMFNGGLLQFDVPLYYGVPSKN